MNYRADHITFNDLSLMCTGLQAFTSKLRVFDLDGVTNRSEELLPGVHSPIHQHNTRLTSRGLRYDPNHFRLHKSFWIRDKFDQGVMPPRAYN